MTLKPSTDQIDACLPQTQCARCGYPRCLDYATAIHEQDEKINRCAPGGDTTLALLSELTAQAATQLDPEVGGFMPRHIALIDEAACIGCVLCIKACPVDAIIGANKTMHSIIEAECTGCELCIPVCPTDCIQMQKTTLGDNEVNSVWPDYPNTFAPHARQRTINRLQRLKQQSQQQAASSRLPKADKQHSMQANILAAIKRKQSKD